MDAVSEIKLIRTDTTLDLSQKAEKVCSRTERLDFLDRLLMSGSYGDGMLNSRKEDSEHVRASQVATTRRNDSEVRSSGESEGITNTVSR